VKRLFVFYFGETEPEHPGDTVPKDQQFKGEVRTGDGHVITGTTAFSFFAPSLDDAAEKFQRLVTNEEFKKYLPK